MYFQVLQVIPNSIIEGIVNGGFESFKGICCIVKYKKEDLNVFKYMHAFADSNMHSNCLLGHQALFNKIRDHIGTNLKPEDQWSCKRSPDIKYQI